MRKHLATWNPARDVWERGGGRGDTEPVLRALTRVLGDLTNLGYDAQWRTLRASSIGAPHHRERIFVLAHRRDTYAYRNRREPWREKPLQANSISPFATRLGERPGSRGSSEQERDTPALNLLPTPTAHDSKGAGTSESYRSRNTQRGRTSSGHLAMDIVHHTHADRSRFGEYAPAICRWETITTRPAPNPTAPSKTGKQQLNSVFSEWMMGLPAGWVTDPEIGLTRSQQLRVIGNGVVPQQATAALIEMIANLEEK